MHSTESLTGYSFPGSICLTKSGSLFLYQARQSQLVFTQRRKYASIEYCYKLFWTLEYKKWFQ